MNIYFTFTNFGHVKFSRVLSRANEQESCTSSYVANSSLLFQLHMQLALGILIITNSQVNT